MVPKASLRLMYGPYGPYGPTALFWLEHQYWSLKLSSDCRMVPMVPMVPLPFCVCTPIMAPRARIYGPYGPPSLFRSYATNGP
eukprot:11492760-Karenia_brevis.AAC.1